MYLFIYFRCAHILLTETLPSYTINQILTYFECDWFQRPFSLFYLLLVFNVTQRKNEIKTIE